MQQIGQVLPESKRAPVACCTTDGPNRSHSGQETNVSRAAGCTRSTLVSENREAPTSITRRRLVDGQFTVAAAQKDSALAIALMVLEQFMATDRRVAANGPTISEVIARAKVL